MRRIVDALEARGKVVWVDFDDIPPSVDWFDRIAAGIDSSDNFLCMISPDWVSSDVCKREIDHAAQRNERMIWRSRVASTRRSCRPPRRGSTGSPSSAPRRSTARSRRSSSRWRPTSSMCRGTRPGARRRTTGSATSAAPTTSCAARSSRPPSSGRGRGGQGPRPDGAARRASGSQPDPRPGAVGAARARGREGEGERRVRGHAANRARALARARAPCVGRAGRIRLHLPEQQALRGLDRCRPRVRLRRRLEQAARNVRDRDARRRRRLGSGEPPARGRRQRRQRAGLRGADRPAARGAEDGARRRPRGRVGPGWPAARGRRRRRHRLGRADHGGRRRRADLGGWLEAQARDGRQAR